MNDDSKQSLGSVKTSFAELSPKEQKIYDKVSNSKRRLLNLSYFAFVCLLVAICSSIYLQKGLKENSLWCMNLLSLPLIIHVIAAVGFIGFLFAAVLALTYYLAIKKTAPFAADANAWRNDGHVTGLFKKNLIISSILLIILVSLICKFLTADTSTVIYPVDYLCHFFASLLLPVFLCFFAVTIFFWCIKLKLLKNEICKG